MDSPQATKAACMIDQPTSSPEQSLLIRHRAGDATAFPQLIADYRRPVYSYLIRCGVAEADRDDLFQEVFIKIHHAGSSYDPSRPHHPWLFTIVANTVRTYVRKRKVQAMVFAEPPKQEPKSTDADAARHAIAKQTAGWLERQIQKLPLGQREVLILTCVEHLPQREVAVVLGLPVNTVKTHLRRARLALVERLEQREARQPEEAS
jgi:RNA polymerase sigma-70 factor (ECF subfamily)